MWLKHVKDVCRLQMLGRCSHLWCSRGEFNVVIPKIPAFIEGRGGGAAPVSFLSWNSGRWEVPLFSFEPSWLLLALIATFVWRQIRTKCLLWRESLLLATWLLGNGLNMFTALGSFGKSSQKHLTLLHIQFFFFFVSFSYQFVFHFVVVNLV